MADSLSAKILARCSGAEVSLIPGGGGDFIVIVDGKVQWDKRNVQGRFPDEEVLVAQLCEEFAAP